MKVDIPGYQVLDLRYLVLDYNGTIAVDGQIPEHMREGLKKLAEKFRIYVVTADTHGTAKVQCAELPVQICTFPSPDAAHAKQKIVEQREMCMYGKWTE